MLYPELRELLKLKTTVTYGNLQFDKSSNRTQGDYASLFHGLGVEFETVRPYVVGDDVRYIDWRVTARIGKPQVKTFRAESDRNVLLVIDANAYMRFGTRVTFKSIQAAKIAALLCWRSMQQQDRVGGLVFGDIPNGIQYFKPTKTDGSILQLLKTLCNTKTDNHAPVPLVAALKQLQPVVTPQSLIFIISDFSLQPINELEKAILNLRQKCKIVLLPVHDPADRDIPDIGQIVFSDGQQQELLNTNNRRARKIYNNLWQNYVTALQQLAKKINVPLLWVETTLDPAKCLFSKTGSILKWKN